MVNSKMWYDIYDALKDPIFSAGSGFYYDSDKGTIVDGGRYSVKEIKDYCKFNKFKHGLKTAIFTTLLISSSLGFKYDGEHGGNKGRLIGVPLSLVSFVGFGRNLSRTFAWNKLEKNSSFYD